MRSMTGYGRLSKNIGDYGYNLEIKSLNSKTLNINTFLSPIFSPMEINIQNFLKKYFKRGSLKVFVDIKFLKTDDVVDVDVGLAKSYYNALSDLVSQLHLTDDVSLDILLKFKDIVKISINESVIEEVWKGLEEMLKEVCEVVISYQKEEGEDLKKVIAEYLENIQNIVDSIAENSSKMKENYREKVRNNLTTLLDNFDDLDEKRIEMEITLLAERSDISEEIERLNSHINRFKRFIESEEDSIGQDLDFICQEMHREFNTIAAKSKLLQITNLSLEGRSLVNKIREQVQNIH